MRGFGSVIGSSYEPVWKEFPIFGDAADIKEGAVVMAGVTEDKNRGMAIIGAVTYADVIGVLGSIHDYSVVGDSAIATGAMVMGKVDINPFNTYLCEWDNTASTLLTAASSSSSTITLSNWRRTIEGGFWYVVSGAGKGQLRYLNTYADDAPTVATDFTTDLVSADKSMVISPPLHGLEDLNATATKLLPASSTSGAVCSGTITVIRSFIQSDGIPFQILDANKHDGLDNLDTQNIRFYSEITFRDHIFNQGA